MDSNSNKNFKKLSASKKTLLSDGVDLHQDEAIASYIQVLEKRNEEVRASRKAALNALEDAILAKEALSISEEKYRNLFESIDEGFCIVEALFDKKGKAYDYRFLEANGSFEKQTGLKDVVGKTIKELVPDHEQHWFDIYGRIAKTGKPERFENAAKALGYFYDVYAFRIDKPNQHHVAVLFNDITERKQAEKNKAYIQKLSDAIRSISDPISIEETVTRLAMDHFATDRCYYCTIEGYDVIIKRDALRGNLPSVCGTYPLSEFAIFKKVVDEGRPFIVEDAKTTGLLDEPLREICLELSIISFIDVPVIKNGKAVGIFCLVQSNQRKWKETEIEIAAQTAERIWTAVEKAKAEEALRESEAILRNFNIDLKKLLAEKSADLAVEHGSLMQAEKDLVSLNSELKNFNAMAANNYAEALRHVYINLETIVTTDARNLSNSSRANLRRAQAAIQKMKLLTNDINHYLELYDVEVRKELINPNNVLIDVKERLQKKLEDSNTTIQIVALPELKADPKLFSKLMANIIDNSIKFKGPDADPLININSPLISEVNSNPNTKENTAYTIVTVTDNGLGFNNEDADKIFGLFTQLDDKHKGSGIGLAICKKIMEMHGGFIAAESEKDKGTSIYCYFPA